MESATVAVGHAHERRAPRPARGQPELADRPPDARDPALHRLRGHAVRGLLRLLLLPPGRRRPAELAAAPLRAAGLRGARQHLHPGLLELHDPLRARGDPQGQPPGPETRPGPDLAARRDLPLHPGQRVRAHRLQRPRHSRSARSSTASPASTAPTSSSVCCCSASRRSAPSAATSARRRRTTSASRCPASTGTSSTSCGSSFS